MKRNRCACVTHSRSMPRSKIDRRFRRKKTTRRPEGRHHDAHDEDISTLRSNSARRPGGSRHLNAPKKGRHQDAPEVRLLRRRSWGRHLNAQEPHSSTPPAGEKPTPIKKEEDTPPGEEEESVCYATFSDFIKLMSSELSLTGALFIERPSHCLDVDGQTDNWVLMNTANPPSCFISESIHIFSCCRYLVISL